jgi:hypothetical protein
MLNINTFWLQIDFITCILCSHAYYQINMNNFCYNHIFKIHNFQSQFSTFEPNVFKRVIKRQLKKNGAHLVEKNKDYWFLRSECFEHEKTLNFFVKLWEWKFCN